MTSSDRPHPPARAGLPGAGPLALTALIAAYVAWSMAHLDVFEWSIDEGMYLMRARMAAAGFGLYDDIWFNHPPLLVELVGLVFARFGQSVTAARAVAVGFGAVGLAGVAFVARELDGWTEAVLAAGLLLLAPLFLGLSRAVMSSLPALAAATLALGCALRFGRTGRGRWLAASGLAFGVGAAIKYIGAPVAPAIALALWPAGGRATWRSRLGAAGGWLAAAALVPALALAPFGAQAVWAQTVGSVFGARGAYPLDMTANLQDLLEWSSEGHLGIALLGAFGLAHGLGRDRRWRVVALWLAAALAAVALQAPLWSHHLVLPLLPLAAAAGHGATALARLARRGGSAPDAGWRAFALTAVGVFALALPVALHRGRETTEYGNRDPDAAIAALGARTAPGDAVITDSPMIAFRAGLTVPPDLCDPGAKRFEAGDLTLADVAGATLDHFPAPVLTWNERFVRGANTRFADWLLDVGYRPEQVFDAGRSRVLYVAPARLPAAPPDDARPVGAVFGADGPELAAVSLPAQRVAAGATLPVTLHWHAAHGPAARPYAVSLRLVASRVGARVAQSDGPPARGVRPMDAWRPGERIADRHALEVDPAAAPGAYALRLRLYDPAGGAVLGVARAGAGLAVDGGEALELGSIEVVVAGEGPPARTAP